MELLAVAVEAASRVESHLNRSGNEATMKIVTWEGETCVGFAWKSGWVSIISL